MPFAALAGLLPPAALDRPPLGARPDRPAIPGVGYVVGHGRWRVVIGNRVGAARLARTGFGGGLGPGTTLARRLLRLGIPGGHPARQRLVLRFAFLEVDQYGGGDA